MTTESSYFSLCRADNDDYLVAEPDGRVFIIPKSRSRVDLEVRGTSQASVDGEHMIIAHDDSKVILLGSALSIAQNSSTIHAHDNSKVIAWHSVTVYAWDNATVHVYSKKVEVFIYGPNVAVYNHYLSGGNLDSQSII